MQWPVKRIEVNISVSKFVVFFVASWPLAVSVYFAWLKSPDSNEEQAPFTGLNS